MAGDWKSGTVSRPRPRSRATIRTEASFSSRATIAAGEPKPTKTTSTFGSVLAMPVALLAADLLRPALVGDRHRLALQVHAVVGVDLKVGGIGTGEADHAPAHHVAVAAIEGIGKEALDRVGEQGFEEDRGGEAAPVDPPRLHVAQEVVALFRASGGEIELARLKVAQQRAERGA